MLRTSISNAIRSISSRTAGGNAGFLASSSIPTLNLRSLLQKPSATVHENDTVQAAVSKMVQEDVGTLAVLSRNGKVVGSLSERSVLLGCNGNPPQKVKVSDVLDKHSVVTVEPNTMLSHHHSITEALESASGRQLPIACLNSGEFLGLVFVSDLVRAMAGECSFVRVMHDEYTGSAPIHDG